LTIPHKIVDGVKELLQLGLGEDSSFWRNGIVGGVLWRVPFEANL